MSNQTADPPAVLAILAAREAIDRYAPMVLATCRRVLGARDLAEDAVQDTFLHFLRHRTRIRGSVPTWLHRVALGKAIDRRRREEARHRHEGLASAQAEAAERDERALLRQEIDAAIDRLPLAQRQLVVGHFFSGLSQAELAEQLDCSPATVSRRLTEALSRMQEHLRPLGLVVGGGMLGEVLATEATATVPTGLAHQLSYAALGGGTVAPAATGMATLVGIAGLIAATTLATAFFLLRGEQTSAAPQPPPRIAVAADPPPPAVAQPGNLRIEVRDQSDQPVAGVLVNLHRYDHAHKLETWTGADGRAIVRLEGNGWMIGAVYRPHNNNLVLAAIAGDAVFSRPHGYAVRPDQGAVRSLTIRLQAKPTKTLTGAPINTQDKPGDLIRPSSPTEHAGQGIGGKVPPLTVKPGPPVQIQENGPALNVTVLRPDGGPATDCPINLDFSIYPIGKEDLNPTPWKTIIHPPATPRDYKFVTFRSSRTDAAGKAVVGGLSPGPWRIRANPLPGAEGVIGATTLVEIPNQDANCTLRLRLGALVSGRIVDGSGTPLTSAQVFLLHEFGESLNFTTDAHGRFATGLLEPGAWRIRAVSADSWHRSSVIERKCAPGPSILPDLRLDPAPPLTVSGRIVGPDDKPQAELPVRLGSHSTRTDSRGEFLFAISTKADGDQLGQIGWLEVDLPEEAALALDKSQYGVDPRRRQRGVGGDGFPGPSESDATRCEIRLVPAVVLRGRVFGPDGKPCSTWNARVWLRSVGGSGTPIDLESDKRAGKWFGSTIASDQLRTAQDGRYVTRFRLDHLAPGHAFTAHSEHRDLSAKVTPNVRVRQTFALFDLPPLSPVPTEWTVPVDISRPTVVTHDLHLAAPNELSLKLVDPQGKPVTGRIGLSRADVEEDFAKGAGIELETDVHGELRIADLRGPRYRISVFTPGRNLISNGPLEHQPGPGLRERQIRLIAGGELNAQVVDPAGRPVVGAAVQLRPSGHPKLKTWPNWFEQSQISDGDGRVVFQRLAGAVDVLADLSHQSDRAVRTLTGPPVQRYPIEPGQRRNEVITVQIAAMARIRLRDPSGNYYSCRAEAWIGSGRMSHSVGWRDPDDANAWLVGPMPAGEHQISIGSSDNDVQGQLNRERPGFPKERIRFEAGRVVEFTLVLKGPLVRDPTNGIRRVGPAGSATTKPQPIPVPETRPRTEDGATLDDF